MSQRVLIILLSLTLGLVSGAFGWSLIVGKRHAQAVEAAREEAREAGLEEGRAAAEKALEAELAALKPVVFNEAPEAENKPGGVEFEYEYVDARSEALKPFQQMAVDGDMLHHQPEVQAIDGMFMLPRPIKYITAECGEVNAFYSAERGEVVMCYETMQVLLQRGEELAAGNELDEGFARRYLDANVRFILLHETGHALISMLEIPITGREEDAVDQLATTLMLRFAGINESTSVVAENLRMASNWFLARSSGKYNLDVYADQHALGEQRYFNLQCMLYGSDPARYLDIVTSGDLPEARAKGCPEESRRVSRAWLRLLLPYVAPKYQMSEEKAERLFEERARERERNADMPYVR
ncbi:DUF4344 domain-containing metallopeptidase [Marilutibacter aestuarii]|uniref:Metallopeptidase n=1 Tax=Marilutibacter aestuarii TaxID=1706195 RepID=A0A508AEC2_9GAMM|nr:DUF4344 domain-containing metallopeptidase [Lysobacter aestuarii]TQD48209.1 hypothetical protein FKV25_05265 [Lysobacter aestuarii]